MDFWKGSACVSIFGVGLDLTCLGTSDAFGSLGRHNAGYLVASETGRLLVDAGPGILSALKSLGEAPGQIDAIVISHLHGDHFAGIPFLLLEFTYQSPRERPLQIIGPPGIEARVRSLYKALYADLGSQESPFPIRFVEMRNGSAFEVGDTRIESFRVPHQDVDLSLGHRISADGASLVYSGDTPWTEDLIRESSGAGLFLCECSTFETEVPKHIRYTDLEPNRDRLECSELLLVHMGAEIRRRSGDIDLPMADDGLRKKVLKTG